MKIGTISFSSWNLAKLFDITTDLPTPVYPVKKEGFSLESNNSRQ
jgi:hypothetical protein